MPTTMEEVLSRASRGVESWSGLLHRTRPGPQMANGTGTSSGSSSGGQQGGTMPDGCFRGAATLVRTLLPKGSYFKAPKKIAKRLGLRTKITVPSLRRVGCGVFLDANSAGDLRCWRQSAYRRVHPNGVRRIPTPNNTSRHEWWPELYTGAHGEPHFCAASGSKPQVHGAVFEADAKELLNRIVEIEGLCDSVRGDAESTVGGLKIQSLVRQAAHSVWSAQAIDSPVAFVCSETVLTTSVPVEAVLWAIYSVEERLSWDGKSFATYSVLRSAAPQVESHALGDVIYCRMPTPTGMSDRDVVQERFLLQLPGGGYAIVMRSPSEEGSAALAEVAPNMVRMRTMLSGYLLRPLPGGGIKLTAMSQTDMGGNIPQWVQSMAKKAGIKKALEWARALETHCNRTTADVVRLPKAETSRGDSAQAVRFASKRAGDQAACALVGGKKLLAPAAVATTLAMVMMMLAFCLAAAWD